VIAVGLTDCVVAISVGLASRLKMNPAELIETTGNANLMNLRPAVTRLRNTVLMSRKRHHVHANIRKIGPETCKLFKAAGFVLDPFIDVESSYAPPIHYCLECNDKMKADAAWSAAVAIVQADPDFQGYIERETVARCFNASMRSQPYEPDRKFPLANLRLSDVPLHKHKRADLHVKRAADRARDQLDIDLVNCGFYEVHTDRNRIYTLQCEHLSDAKRIFLLLKKFLSIAGGADQVNFEVVSKFLRKPEDFKLPRYLSRSR